ncbi:MAG: GTPase Era [Desulfovibrionaceae bacterium]
MKKEYRCGSVALIGPTNAGKSTLLNSILDHKVSIVTPKANTTRNQIIGIHTTEYMQVVFMDTPGFQTHKGLLQRAMSHAITQSKHEADILMLVVDIHLYITRPHFLENDLNDILHALSYETRPLFIILNKTDLFSDKARMLPTLEKLHAIVPNAELFPLSAMKKDRIHELSTLIYEVLPKQEALYPKDQISTSPLSFMAKEIIREQLFLKLDQEVPYSSAVEIDTWEEDNIKAVIYATIFIDRPSQKAIILGKKGLTIKEIGIQSRRRIQELLEKKVHLTLWVKVQKNWREDPLMLQEFGISS